jgi:hypothetical protein
MWWLDLFSLAAASLCGVSLAWGSLEITYLSTWQRAKLIAAMTFFATTAAVCAWGISL